ncbi:MAG: DUF2752 domain-containing protein [Verrucomicrobiae bacterium]|nr:DUF2752 domain-containing protein [Verrucomicrobiae bacterium]
MTVRPTGASKMGTGLLPIAAPILSQRRFTQILCGTLILLAIASALGVSLWHCPVLITTGFPCPGCGLTRGVMATLKGDLAEAVEYHPFSPLALVFLTLLAIGSILPRQAHSRLIQWLDRIERRTGIVLFPLAACVVYGLTRMAIACYNHLSF